MRIFRSNFDANQVLSPDLDDAERFLQTLDPTTDRFCFQTFDDSPQKRGKLVRVLHGTLNEHAPELTKVNNRGGGIFVPINEIEDGATRDAQHTKRVRAFYVDADKPDEVPIIEEKINQSGLTPSIIVESSPGKFHYYWLTNDCPLEQFTSIQEALIVALNTDRKIKDLPRVMRLPGFFHRKEAPFCTRIVRIAQ